MNPSSVPSSRRRFLKSAVSTGAGLLILPGGHRLGAQAPSNKLNVLLIGVWGRGQAHYDSLSEQNVVALCDVNEKRFPDALKKFPNAKTYVDWRQAVDHKGLDAVVCCSADHTHAFVANWCLNRNLHIYCEKPLAISVEEARTVRANWLTKKGKLATQVGMQRHAMQNFNRVRELVRDGAIGAITDAFAWGNRQIRRDKYPAGEGAPPEGFHFDLWLGPSPDHPYTPAYFKGVAGMNCLEWNMFQDFGAGQIGDMGSHTMDLLWNAVDAKLPTSVVAKGDPFNAEVTPVELEAHFEHPANDWRGPINVGWYQGGAMPRSPKPEIDLNKIDHGVMFKGKSGYVIADFSSRLIVPFGDNADLSYYKPRNKETLLPDLGHFQKQWFDACKDPGKPTACDFEYSGNMIEQMLLGLVAHRVGKKFNYDSTTGQATDCPEANQFMGRKYREGWTLNG